MPAFLSNENAELLAIRIGEYAKNFNLPRLLVVYHGGEPLLIGVGAIEQITKKIRQCVPESTSVDFSLQTNGMLLNEDVLDKLEELNICVSLSLDGPEIIHDKHRSDHAGKPSFYQVETGLKLLLNRPKVFGGIISVIDPTFPPAMVLEYFNSFPLPSLDFLLPDANHNRHPPGKDENPRLYTDWLLECFDLWFDHYSHIRVRFFDSILDSIVGLPSKTDSLGFGDISLLTIETDGSYHDLDVLKIAYDGATNLGLGNLKTHSIEDAAASSQLERHRKLLNKDGLSDICKKCQVVDICAGGSVPHRYSNDGFANPSIYCIELYSVINRAKKRLADQLEVEIEASKTVPLIILSESNLLQFEDTSSSYSLLEEMLSSWGNIQRNRFIQALDVCEKENPAVATPFTKDLLSLSPKELSLLSLQPSVYAWTNVINARARGEIITSIDGKEIFADYSYVRNIKELLQADFKVQRINRNDYWLRVAFGEKIQYEPDEISAYATTILEDAYCLINEWDSNLLKEIKLIAPEIQFIKDFTAHPEKIVSFSDNSVPGALYVTVKLGNKFIDASDLADSILHEYRHQKLYLLQRISDVVSIDVPLVPSPWREELRPPSGLFHAIYVFAFLRKFWEYLSTTKRELQDKAKNEVTIITNRLQKGINTVRQTKLTETGLHLLHILEADLIEEPS